MAARVVKGVCRLRVSAGQAKPSPAIGQALGPLGVNMMEFCKQFNEQTKTYKLDRGTILPVHLTAFEDRTFAFEVKTPPTSWYLKQAAGIQAGSSEPGKTSVGTISARAVYEIAQMKRRDATLANIPLESMCKTVIGTAKTMGLEVVD
jgi:large subunit ribosomal protein L11